MANEKRVRVNSLGGLVEDNPLTSGATTLTSAGLAALVLIDTTNHAVIVIDPDGLESAPEIVYVTAHTASATTATILRAQEGTTAAAHSVDIPWVHAPTIKDYPKKVDDPWGGDVLANGPYDQEFDADGSPTTPPTGWAWVNQGTATYVEEFGAGHIVGTAQAGDQMRMITRTLPNTTSWVATARIVSAFSAINYSQAGLILRESSTGKMYALNILNQSFDVSLVHWSGPTVAVATDGTDTPKSGIGPQYFRVRKNSATSFDYAWSFDGIAWRYFLNTFNPTYCTPDQIGFFTDVALAAAGSNEVACHWMRIR